MKKMISRLSALLLAFISGMTAMFIPVSASGYGIKADSRTTNTIRLVWEDQDKADAYRVYKYDASKKKFKEYKTVVANQCTITDLKPGTGYKFKVRALRKNKKGKFAKLSESGVVTVKTLSKSGSSGKSGSDSSKKKPSATEAMDKDSVLQQYNDAVRDLSNIDTQIEQCERNIEVYQDTISRYSGNDTEYGRTELFKAQNALDEENKKLRDLTRQRTGLKNDVDRLRSTLHMMGVRTV
ncbi:MAG: fibronectin type III domain-containing protein [Oscillospiraceae bacterium]|nr:fibronectin type III domain-containing protein [Oscillospiraceae bacterium]